MFVSWAIKNQRSILALFMRVKVDFIVVLFSISRETLFPSLDVVRLLSHLPYIGEHFIWWQFQRNVDKIDVLDKNGVDKIHTRLYKGYEFLSLCKCGLRRAYDFGFSLSLIKNPLLFSNYFSAQMDLIDGSSIKGCNVPRTSLLNSFSSSIQACKESFLSSSF